VPTSADFLAYVLEQLAGLEGVSDRRMFGGTGLYCEELFFGLISGDVLYLRVDDCNRSDFTARGAAQFRPYADRPQLSMSYYEIPADVLEDAAECVRWAQRSVEVAMRAPAARRPRKARKARKARTTRKARKARQA
jgi:DNA transformation protein